jgi:hypothetical protein
MPSWETGGGTLFGVFRDGGIVLHGASVLGGNARQHDAGDEFALLKKGIKAKRRSGDTRDQRSEFTAPLSFLAYIRFNPLPYETQSE